VLSCCWAGCFAVVVGSISSGPAARLSRVWLSLLYSFAESIGPASSLIVASISSSVYWCSSSCFVTLYSISDRVAWLLYIAI
jgi:hypothetical protein